MTICSNNYLTVAQMTPNAQYILDYLLGKGWTKNAICGVLGNMQSESTINPCLWESRDAGNLNRGYGLVQWTPASKYINWCNAQGIPYANIESNLKRLDYEVEGNFQWINSLDPKGRSFKQFTRSTDTPYDLAMAFIKAYERPRNPNQPIRGTQANYWFKALTGGGTSFSGNIIDFYLRSATGLSITSEYGMRKHPITGLYTMHAGTDIAKSGSPSPQTLTPSRVKIIHAGNSGTTAGTWVVYHIIDSPYMVGIFHMANVTVSKGDIVDSGVNLGLMGATGGVTGRHWHIEVRDYTESSYWVATHYDPRSIEFNIEGGGGGGEPETPKTGDNLIHLYLSGAVNNWL